jgi:hypothetical protein
MAFTAIVLIKISKKASSSLFEKRNIQDYFVDTPYTSIFMEGDSEFFLTRSTRTEIASPYAAQEAKEYWGSKFALRERRGIEGNPPETVDHLIKKESEPREELSSWRAGRLFSPLPPASQGVSFFGKRRQRFVFW